MKILIINLVDWPFDENSLTNVGLGGSETWAIQLADAFANKHHEVSVVCNCIPHISNSGVAYIPQSNMDDIIINHKYDLCIISRHYSNLISILDSYHTTDKVFVQAHDNNIYGFESISSITQAKCFKGVATLSGYQERCIHDKTGLDWKYMVRIGNGIDPKLFENINITPSTPRILFSSDYSRGGDIIVNSIIPRLNNIGADFCSYTDNNISHNNNISFIGSLDKIRLYIEMGKRYFWFYPGTVNETFCITALESIMCENDLILPINSGLITVLEPYIDDISMKYCFNGDDNEYELAVNEAVERINTSIYNHESGAELRKELKNYVLSKYTWDLIADKWLKIV